MDKHTRHSWQEIITAIKPLEGKILQGSARLKFEIVTVTEAQIIVKRLFSIGRSQVLDLTTAWERVYGKIENIGCYRINTQEASVNKIHRYCVYVMAKECTSFFSITHDHADGTDIIRYADSKISLINDTLDTPNYNYRITAIVGAGAAVGLVDDFDKRPTTANITREIFNSVSKISTPVLLATIRKKMLPAYENNFEAYFHVMEQLVTYHDDWLHQKDKNWQQEQILSSFISAGKGLKPHDGDKRPYSILKDMYIALMSVINTYNQLFNKERDNTLLWYSSFWTDARFLWDAFTFNYDTTIEVSLGDKCIDGYYQDPNERSFQRFNPRKYIEEKAEHHTVNHMHGCILYSGQKPNYEEDDAIEEIYAHNQVKSLTAEDALTRLETRAGRPGRAQTGEFLWQDSIITGLHKTDKIVSLPYSFYRNQLENSILTNNKVVIIGYSFNDYYVNHILECMPLYHTDYRIVIVDKCDVCDVKIDYDVEFDRFFRDNKEQKRCLLHFVRKMLFQDGENRRIWEHFDYTHINESYIVSKDNRLMFHIGGFYEAAKHKEQIYDFLTTNN